MSTCVAADCRDQTPLDFVICTECNWRSDCPSEATKAAKIVSCDELVETAATFTKGSDNALIVDLSDTSYAVVASASFEVVFRTETP